MQMKTWTFAQLQ